MVELDGINKNKTVEAEATQNNITAGNIALLILPSDFHVSPPVNRSVGTQDISNISRVSKSHRDLIENCIFLSFFLSLLLVGFVILRRAFKRNKKNSLSGSKLSKSKYRRASTTKNPRDSYSSRVWNVQELEYYYVQPRRILWESFYGNPANQSHSSAIIPNVSCFEPDVVAEVDLLKGSRSPPPKYNEVLRGVDHIKRVSLIELPSYSEAVLKQPTRPHPVSIDNSS